MNFKFTILSLLVILLSCEQQKPKFENKASQEEEKRSAQMHHIEDAEFQFLICLAESMNSQNGKLLLYSGKKGNWKKHDEDIAISFGKNGLAWAESPWAENPWAKEKGPKKVEGDLRSPAGAFTIESLFGKEEIQSNCPFVKVHENLQCIEDVNSQYYNDIIDNRNKKKDWNSTDIMLRDDELYDFGFMLESNITDSPGKGSCIFFHIWSENNKPTAGCTAMSKANMKKIIEFLDCDKMNIVVQCTYDHYQKIQDKLGYPKIL